MKSYSREKMISLADKPRHAVHQQLLNSLKDMYAGNGRLLRAYKEGEPELEELRELGFSKYECDYTMNYASGDVEKASNLLFMEYNLRQLMKISFHFESFIIWQDIERNQGEIIENAKPLCLVSTFEEFKQLSSNVKDALAQNIPIVSQYFLFDSEYLNVKVFPEDYPIKEVKFLYDTPKNQNLEHIMSDYLKLLFSNYDHLSPIRAPTTISKTLSTSSSLSLVPHVPFMSLSSIAQLKEPNKTAETMNRTTTGGNTNMILHILANKDAPQEFNKACNVTEMESQLSMFVHFLAQVLSDEKLKLSEKYQAAKVIPKLLEFGNHSHNSFSKTVDELLIENKIIDKIILYYVEYPFNNVVHSFVTQLLISIFQYYHFELQIHLIKNLGHINLQEFIIRNFDNNALSPYLTMVSRTINHMCTYRKSFELFIFDFEPWRKFSETLADINNSKYNESTQLDSNLRCQIEQRKSNLLLQDKLILTEEWKDLPCTLIEPRKTTKFRCLYTECDNEVAQHDDFCSNGCKIKDFKKSKSQKTGLQ